MEKELSVQICSYNRKELLEKVLRSLFDQTYPRDKFEVVVVDDGSTDGTSEMVSALQAPIDLVFFRQEKEGLAAGRNKGVLKARGKVILFIDDDVLADLRLVEEHARFHRLYPGSVVKGWVNHVSEMKRPLKPRWTRRDFSTAFFWTSNVSVEKKYLLQAGLFDETFKEYGWEDLELGLRLKSLGLKSCSNPKAIGYHYKRKMHGRDLPLFLSQAEAKGRTAVLFVKKNPCWQARLSTGIYPLRLGLDRVFSPSWLLRFYSRFIPTDDTALSFWSKLCANALAKARYFKTIRHALQESE